VVGGDAKNGLEGDMAIKASVVAEGELVEPTFPIWTADPPLIDARIAKFSPTGRRNGVIEAAIAA